MSPSESSLAETRATGPTYYAEYLPNINSVTLTIDSLTPGATFGLSATELSLLLTYPSNSTTVSISLPAKCTTTSPGVRITQSLLSNQTTIRLPAHPSEQSSTALEAVVPWSANHLTASVELRCKHCQAVIVQQGRVGDWRDLPSEGWAEMMDLWHCHKPDEHHLHGEHGGEAKGYAAGARLVARPGIGFVDVLSFLVHEEDVGGVEIQTADSVSQSSDQKRLTTKLQQLKCESCTSLLGYLDTSTSGLRLLKPFLALSTMDSARHSTAMASSAIDTPGSDNNAMTTRSSVVMGQASTAQSFSMTKWLSAYLLSLTTSSGVRKFRLAAPSRGNDPGAEIGSTTEKTLEQDGTDEKIGKEEREREIWVFNTDLVYTSSASSASSSTSSSQTAGPETRVSALKIFYRALAPSPHTSSTQNGHDSQSSSVGRERKGGESLSRENLHIEEISLPLGLDEVLWAALEQGTKVLPLGQRKFGEWDVCVLEKFRAGSLEVHPIEGQDS